jgi:MYXO-CTERM domain-containing protein
MNRVLFPALLVIAAILLCQPIQVDGASLPCSESAFMGLGNAEGNMPGGGVESRTITFPEEPPTGLLLAIGLAMLAGLRRKWRKTDAQMASDTKGGAG